jgi:hypothetical protein
VALPPEMPAGRNGGHCDGRHGRSEVNRPSYAGYPGLVKPFTSDIL